MTLTDAVTYYSRFIITVVYCYTVQAQCNLATKQQDAFLEDTLTLKKGGTRTA